MLECSDSEFVRKLVGAVIICYIILVVRWLLVSFLESAIFPPTLQFYEVAYFVAFMLLCSVGVRICRSYEHFLCNHYSVLEFSWIVSSIY